jgi:hypothetical protein
MDMDIDAMRPPTPSLVRLTNIFQRGEPVEFSDDDGVFYLFVAAMNDVEREEAVLDGAVAQARANVLAGPGSEQYEALKVELERLERQEIIDRLLMTRGVEGWNLGQDDLHTDDYWRGDRLLLIERGDASVTAGATLTDEENASLARLNEEYLAAWRARAVTRLEGFKAEYETQTTEELVTAYLKAYGQVRSMGAQIDEYRITMLLYGTRTCSGKFDEGKGRIDHSACGGHRERVFPARESVRAAPSELTSRLLEAAERIDRTGGAALGK